MDTRTHLCRVRIGPTVALLIVTGLLSVAAQASGANLSTRAGGRRTMIEVQSTLAGSVVTDTRGYVLFAFPKEHRSDAFCERRKNCMIDWPPVTTAGKPIAGPGLNASLLGSIPYKGRLRQVTYSGRPLHTYKFAYSAQSSVLNIGIKQFGGPWDALTASGQLLK